MQITPSLDSDIPTSKANVLRALREAGSPVRPATIDWLREAGKLRAYPADPTSTAARPRYKYRPDEVAEALRNLVVKPRSAAQVAATRRVAERAAQGR